MVEVFLRDLREIGEKMESSRSSFLFFSGRASVISRALFLSISIPRWCTRNPKKFSARGYRDYLKREGSPLSRAGLEPAPLGNEWEGALT